MFSQGVLFNLLLLFFSRLLSCTNGACHVIYSSDYNKALLISYPIQEFKVGRLLLRTFGQLSRGLLFQQRLFSETFFSETSVHTWITKLLCRYTCGDYDLLHSFPSVKRLDNYKIRSSSPFFVFSSPVLENDNNDNNNIIVRFYHISHTIWAAFS